MSTVNSSTSSASSEPKSPRTESVSSSSAKIRREGSSKSASESASLRRKSSNGTLVKGSDDDAIEYNRFLLKKLDEKKQDCKTLEKQNKRLNEVIGQQEMQLSLLESKIHTITMELQQHRTKSSSGPRVSVESRAGRASLGDIDVKGDATPPESSSLNAVESAVLERVRVWMSERGMDVNRWATGGSGTVAAVTKVLQQIETDIRNVSQLEDKNRELQRKLDVRQSLCQEAQRQIADITNALQSMAQQLSIPVPTSSDAASSVSELCSSISSYIGKIVQEDKQRRKERMGNSSSMGAIPTSLLTQPHRRTAPVAVSPKSATHPHSSQTSPPAHGQHTQHHSSSTHPPQHTTQTPSNVQQNANGGTPCTNCLREVTNIIQGSVEPQQSTSQHPSIPDRSGSKSPMQAGKLKEAFTMFKDEMSCAVCMDVLFNDPVVLPSCGHAFCRRCLMGLHNNVCPVCRVPLPTQPKSTLKSCSVINSLCDKLYDIERELSVMLGEALVDKRTYRRSGVNDKVDAAPTAF